MFLKCTCLLVFLCLSAVFAVDERAKPRSLGRVFNIFGPKCTGCPTHFCDDDPAIVLGYCCGCARFYDNLPVRCNPLLVCPPTNYLTCQNYEYMMHCCC